MKFITVHILHTLPLHNLNRDQSGLPKSQFDGGVQRGRLSPQSLKRAARTNYLKNREGSSMRTRNAADLTFKLAQGFAADKSIDFDEKKGRAEIKKVINSLARGSKKEEEASDDSQDSQGSADNILFFANSELITLAHAAVEKQHSDETLSLDDCIQDAKSASLDIAAFGRMFAAQADLGTHAAIAVSQATTTHQFALTSDYFSAVEDDHQDHAGAGHIGMTYYTSGTYYRSFTIDIDQLRRSWSAVDAAGSKEDLSELIGCLIRSLPSGRVTNSNPHTVPTIVLAEQQKSRIAYDFDTPVMAQKGGGYKQSSAVSLAEKRRFANRFDASNFGEAVVAGEISDKADFQAKKVDTLGEVIEFITDSVYGEYK